MVYVAVCVGDILIFSNNNAWKNKLKASLEKNFSMKDLGEAGTCIGMKISRYKKNGTISLDQTKYIEQILDRFGMLIVIPLIHQWIRTPNLLKRC